MSEAAPFSMPDRSLQVTWAGQAPSVILGLLPVDQEEVKAND
jgi:hypothetical protein